MTERSNQRSSSDRNLASFTLWLPILLLMMWLTVTRTSCKFFYVLLRSGPASLNLLYGCMIISECDMHSVHISFHANGQILSPHTFSFYLNYVLKATLRTTRRGPCGHWITCIRVIDIFVAHWFHRTSSFLCAWTLSSKYKSCSLPTRGQEPLC